MVRRYNQGWAAHAGRAALHEGRRRVPAVWLPALALAAVLAADVSGLSKAEVERIWLPYEVWLLVATAWLPPAARRPALALQTLVALAINHLLLTNW